MKIGITTFGCDLKSGMSRYITNLITQFSKAESNDQIDVFAHENAVSEYFSEVKPGTLNYNNVSEWFENPILNIAWHQSLLPAKSKLRKYDALFLPAASRRTTLWSPCPTIGTVHDFSPFHISGKYDTSRSIYQKKVLPIMLKRLTHIISISESTKQDILEYVDIPEERITVIHHAADTDFFYPRDKPSSIIKLGKYGVRDKYIVYTSRIESPGKNHLKLIQAFENLKRNESIPHQLVLAGADWNGAEDVHEAASRSQFSNDILLTGFVSSEDLPLLYSGAELMVFPSLFEGFGLPILEAMACGVPVACSNISSMPEIAGGAAILFDPHDVDSISQSMSKVLQSQDEREKLTQKGLERARDFSWEKTARHTLDVIHRVAGV